MVSNLALYSVVDHEHSMSFGIALFFETIFLRFSEISWCFLSSFFGNTSDIVSIYLETQEPVSSITISMGPVPGPCCLATVLLDFGSRLKSKVITQRVSPCWFHT